MSKDSSRRRRNQSDLGLQSVEAEGGSTAPDPHTRCEGGHQSAGSPAAEAKRSTACRRVSSEICDLPETASTTPDARIEDVLAALHCCPDSIVSVVQCESKNPVAKLSPELINKLLWSRQIENRLQIVRVNEPASTGRKDLEIR